MKKTKGITPVIALVMLMLITVGIIGLAYTWFSSLASSQTEKGISIPPGGAKCYKLGGNNYVTVLLQNNGATSNILPADIIIATINGVDCMPTIPAGLSIGPGLGGAVFTRANSTLNCGGGAAGVPWPAGTYPVIVGTRTIVAQTQVLCA